MRKFSVILTIAAISVMAFFTACKTEVEPVGPTASLVSGTNAVTDTASVALDSTFLVKVSATAGDADLNRIEVRENGTAVDKDRLTFDGFPAGSNPSPLDVSLASGLDWDIEIVAPSTEGEFNYTIILTDSDGLTSEVSVDITTFIPFTAVDTMSMVLLWNQAGPAGRGGLDLETGNSTGTGSSETTHDLADLGIDTNLPQDRNWIKQFQPANGATLKEVDNTTVSFEGTQFKEEVEEIYNNATEITKTETVEVGDLYAVKTADDITYFLIVTEVNEVFIANNTPGNNDDYYKFDVKF